MVLAISTVKGVFFNKMHSRLFHIILLLAISVLFLNWYLLDESTIKKYSIKHNNSNGKEIPKGPRTTRNAKEPNVADKFGNNIILKEGYERFITNSSLVKGTATVSKPEPIGKYGTTTAKGKSATTTQFHLTRRPSEEAPKPNESLRICPNHSLQLTHQAEYGTCTPHRPTEEACKFAQELYQVDSSLSECKTRSLGDVCEISVSQTKMVSFRCSETLCQQGENGSFTVQGVDPKTGYTTVETTFSSITELEDGLPEIVRENHKHKLNFVFIECKNHDGKKVSQLLPFDPRFTIIEKENLTRNENLINVNIVLIDSVSRAHFYRSLSRTIKTFQNWRENPNATQARVFDFELFQALHGHTAENTHALFTGKLFPVENNGDTLPVEMDVLFGEYKRAGYHTIWQEDLCWEGIWGLMTDLGVRRWTDLQNKLQTTFIDHTGITHSSCKILKSLGRTDPFGGPDGDQICYNGKFQHSYFLRQTIDTLHAISTSRNALPLFSYTALNVGHDHRAVRTQTLDVELERYVTAMAKDANTLTIILADHGNTYTRYTTTVLEGRFEMFHPSLFVIVPNKVASRLGQETMRALETNQRRLVTMIDLHQSLMALVDNSKGGAAKHVAGFSEGGAVNHVGLFTPVSPNRTCNQLELRTPNLCVCEGWDVPAENDTSRIPLAEFAIGKLNTRLQEEYEKYYSRMAEKGSAALIRRSCKQLQPLWFENVRERNSIIDGSLITSMDIRVKAGDVVEQKEDVFHVEVRTKETPSENSLEMKLVTFDRLTLFGNYKTCADDAVDLKLCVCSLNATKTRSLNASTLQNNLQYFDQLPSFEAINKEKCLWLVKRRHGGGSAMGFDVANFCLGQTYRVKIDATSSNMKFSRTLPFFLEIKPRRVLFAFSLGKHLSYWEAYVKVTTKVLKTIK